MADFMIELKGTPEDVQAMVNKGSRIDGATAYKKKWVNPGLCRVWYRGKRTAPNDLVAAIKRKAGLTKAKRLRKSGAGKSISEALESPKPLGELITDAAPDDVIYVAPSEEIVSDGDS